MPECKTNAENPGKTAPGKLFNDTVTQYASSIDSLLSSLPIVMAKLESDLNQSARELKDYVQKHGRAAQLGDEMQYTVYGPALKHVVTGQKALTAGVTAYRLIHRSFLTSLISQYDAYIGRLLRLVYLVRPERLQNSEKHITFRDLAAFASIDEARDRLIEREVDGVIRRSHEDQIGWIKDSLDVDPVKIIPELPAFVEIAQRRHLFVHCDGVVSTQYIVNCQKAGVSVSPETVLGMQLEVTKEYLEAAYEAAFAVGVKLGVAVWLKLLKQDIEQAASCLNALAFELIGNQRYGLVINLLGFATSGKDKASDRMHRFLLLNLAQAYKWAGNPGKCTELLNAHDWSACEDVIKIGVAALTQDVKGAVQLVKKLRYDDKFKKEDYREWPIFSELRKHPEFQAAYKDAYSEDFGGKAFVTAEPAGESGPFLQIRFAKSDGQ